MATACTLPAQTAPPAQQRLAGPTALDRAALAAANARFTQAFANGFNFKVTGTAASANIFANGTVHIASGPGTVLKATLARIPKNSFRVQLVGARTVSSFEEGCDDCGNDGTPPPSETGPTPPPNVRSCADAGGVAWGSGPRNGCLGSGDSIPFCGGTWSWLSPGRGRFVALGADFTGSWAAEDLENCTWGA